MTADGSTFRVGPLPIEPGARLSYSFPFFVNGAAQNTPVFNYTAPAGSPLLALRQQVASYSSGFEIQLIALSDLAWADVHYSINNGPLHQQRGPCPARVMHLRRLAQVLVMARMMLAFFSVMGLVLVW